MEKVTRTVSLLLMIAMTTAALVAGGVRGDPSAPPWDVVYDVDWLVPEESNPVWTKTASSGSATASAGDYLRIYRMGAVSASVIWERNETIDLTQGFTLRWKARIDSANDGGVLNLYVYSESQGYGVGSYFQNSGSGATLTFDSTISGAQKWVSINADQFYDVTFTVGRTTTSQTRIRGYLNGTLQVEWDEYWSDGPAKVMFSGSKDDVDPNLDADIDWIAYAFTDKVRTMQQYDEIIADLEDQVNSLENRLEDLSRARDGEITCSGCLPHVPNVWSLRGVGAGDAAYTRGEDPAYTIDYVTKSNGTGNSISLYLTYPTAYSDIVWQRDEVDFAGTWSQIWLNDTSPAELLNVTVPLAYVDLLGLGNGNGNLTAEVSGGSNFRVDRETRILVRDTFEWEKNPQTGTRSYGLTVDNDIAYDWSEIVVTIAFPGTVRVDTGTVIVEDETNDETLVPGDNYLVTDGGIQLGLNELDAGDEWAFSFSWNPLTETPDRVTVTIAPANIEADNSYPNRPLLATKSVTMAGNAKLDRGEVTFVWALAGSIWAERQLDDGASVLLVLKDGIIQEDCFLDGPTKVVCGEQTIEAGTTGDYEIYFAFKDRPSAIQSLISPIGVVIGVILLGAGVLLAVNTIRVKRLKEAGAEVVKMNLGFAALLVLVGGFLTIVSILMG